MECKEICVFVVDGWLIKLLLDIICFYCDIDDKVSYYCSYN